ncbi:MAG: type III-A CRISPR-associated protein Cas10/Csm1 [Geoalkalibacter sp.]|uniref:type III-A CRISPR-associated protein Cas10/Csm1 n=1 Tax=Geoalkalibacter sp. TaxID=3041440 RepID=UPI003D0B341B
MDNREQELLVLGALLHDIGKFAQRAGAAKSEDSVGYCPQENGRPTHTHVLYTDHFIENELVLPEELEGQRSRLARLAASHHRPAGDSAAEQALCHGDRLSAGTDRKSGEDTEGDYKSARLLSIFEQIELRTARPLEDLQKGRYHCLSPIEQDPYPTSLEQARKSDYATLYRQFCAALQELPLDGGVSGYIASMQSLLERYCWCIPSSTYRSLSDISLFDHSLTTAAIAQALYAFHQEEGGKPGENSETQPKFLLLGGDLSGIQSYIFDLDKSQGSGVAKLFRARSFYLQALTRSVVNEVLQRLGLNPVARIMDAGGRFVLLLPATQKVRDFLEEFELEVQRFFFARFQGALSLNLCFSVELTEKDLEQKRFQKRLNEFNDVLEARKLRQFDRLITQGQSPVIDTDYAAYGDFGDCHVCHKRPADPQVMREHQQHYGRELKLCRDCGDQIHLIGRKLPRTHFMVLSREDTKESVELFAGQYLRFCEKVSAQSARDAIEIVNLRRRGHFAYLPIAAHLPEISEEDIARWQKWGALQSDGEQYFYRDEPVVAGDAKTFSLLALESTEDGKDGIRGRRFLGAFKADVDNLGLIFSVGLQDRLSISRFASLSRMLNHFFSDDLVRYIEEEFPDLYVIFAGGDDLFLLGPWNQAVQFAAELRKRFARFVAERPQITLSAGVAVVKPALPVQSIADQAEELLDFAKSRPQKDAVTLFGTTVGWGDFERLLDAGDWLHRLAGDGVIPRGLLSRLLYYGREHIAFHKKGEIKRGIYLSHMSYDFARNLQEKNLPDQQERNKILAVKTDDFLLSHIDIPASYALYRLRKDT